MGDFAGNVAQAVPGTTYTGPPPGTLPKMPTGSVGSKNITGERPGYNKVKGYEKADGTFVKQYNRRSPGDKSSPPPNNKQYPTTELGDYGK